MKKVLLTALLAFAGIAVVFDASAWFGRRSGYANGCGRSCGQRSSCERSCGPVCNDVPVAVTRLEEKPCGPAPCCLTAVQIPANLVKKVEYEWECPTGCTVNTNMEGAY